MLNNLLLVLGVCLSPPGDIDGTFIEAMETVEAQALADLERYEREPASARLNWVTVSSDCVEGDAATVDRSGVEWDVVLSVCDDANDSVVTVLLESGDVQMEVASADYASVRCTVDQSFGAK